MPHKTVLVSGASGNLGAAVIDCFLKQGCTVIGIVHNQSTNRKAHQNYKEIKIDLTDPTATEKEIKKIITADQHIDVCVMSAGGFAMGNLENTDIRKMKEQYQLNFATAYNLFRPIYKQMKTQAQGKLFFIGSEPGMNPRKGKAVVAYSLAKSLLFQLANIINTEIKNKKIQAHVIVPRTIDTPENRKSVPTADFTTWQKLKDIAEIIHRYSMSPTREKQNIIIEKELQQ